MELLVFVSSTCSHCPVAERAAAKVAPSYFEHGLSYRKIRIKTSEGKDLSAKYNVMSVPTLLFLDDEGMELNRVVGAPSEDGLKKKIETLLGIRKSFLDRLFGNKDGE